MKKKNKKEEEQAEEEEEEEEARPYSHIIYMCYRVTIWAKFRGFEGH